MRIRRAVCGLLLASASCFLGASWGARSQAQETAGSGGAQVVALKDQLRIGLRTDRPADLAFIAQVVAMVDHRQLPRDVVMSTFAWARKRPPHPFPYFERGLRVRAAKLGITIPGAPN
jgi:hypothetical protein